MKAYPEYARRIVLGALALLAGCRAEAPLRPAQGPRDADDRAAFDRLEDEILRDLAAIDGRIALRAHVTPSEDDLQRVALAAVLREDASVAVVHGAIDPFSFDARARGLAAATQKVARLPGRAAASERELLGRLVDAETVRLEEERALPRSASALVRAVVETWRAPRNEREAESTDRWIARRLTDVGAAMTKSSDPHVALDVVRSRELDDALDALEKLARAPEFTRTMQALVLVREGLEALAMRPAARAVSDWENVGRRIRAELGLATAPEELSRSFAALEGELRARAATAKVDASTDDAILPERHCVDEVAGSRVRSMSAPPEREASCLLRHFVASAAADSGDVWVVLHDHVVVAQWALDVARGTATLAQVQGKQGLLAHPDPAARARYERVALARPVAAIGAGETVRLLMAGGTATAKARATAWAALGDVPLDIAARELGEPARR